MGYQQWVVTGWCPLRWYQNSKDPFRAKDTQVGSHCDIL
jgi:hypothetical protein